MDQRVRGARNASALSAALHPAAWLTGGALLVLLACVVLPAAPILVGALLVAAAALHALLPEMRPYVQPLLRVPVGRASKRHGRLLLAAGVGVLLLVCGSMGATLRGHLRSRWEQNEQQRLATEANLSDLLDRARNRLVAWDIDGAQLALLDAGAIPADDSELREELDALSDRLHRSGDRDAILGVLTRLPQSDFEAFASGAAVPAELEFPERVLAARAVNLALEQLDEARRMRAAR